MNLKEEYNKYLPIADAVVKMFNIKIDRIEEDVLSTAQLNVFEFCNLILPQLDVKRGGEFLNTQCFNYVYKKTFKTYRSEMKNYFQTSLNSNIKLNKNQDSTLTLQDNIQDKSPNAQLVLEEKNADKQVNSILAQLNKKNKLIIKSFIKDTDLTLKDISQKFEIDQQQIYVVIKSFLKSVYNEAGELTYIKYSHLFYNKFKQRNLKQSEIFFKHISPKRRNIYLKHFYNGETYLKIAKIYKCSWMNIQSICRKIKKSHLKFLNSTNSEKQNIIYSLERTQKYHKVERTNWGLNQVVFDLIKLKNFKDIIALFPNEDQIIINEYLIKGKTSETVSKVIKFSKSGVQKRGNLLCKKLEKVVYGTDEEKTRTIQMLNKNHWQEHKIKPEIKVFMKNENFKNLVSLFPNIDQTIIFKYFIQGLRTPEVAKEIGLGRSGLSHRAVNILKNINILNNGSDEQKSECLNLLKIEKEKRDKVKTLNN